MLAERIQRDWYRGAAWLYLLRPLSWLFQKIVERRRRNFLSRTSQLWQPPVPVVVIGNISLGGTGKSPLTTALADQLRRLGYRPGIVSRGYGGESKHYPLTVTADSDPHLCGDEPVMLAAQTRCPLVVDPLRVRAAQALLSNHDCNIILCDDGLQHYALVRHLELAVVDGARGLGNGWCLPAGPLREPESRLLRVDAVVCNGVQQAPLPLNPWSMRLVPESFVHLLGEREEPLESWQGLRVHAVAGIGNPERFFSTLRGLGMEVIPHAFGDHHRFHYADLEFNDGLPVVMTEKDAVKCRAFGLNQLWALRVRAELDEEFHHWFAEKLQSIQRAFAAVPAPSKTH